MLKKLLSIIAIVIATSGFLFSQSGVLKGKITDKDTKEPLSYASVVIESGGKQYGGAMSDDKGYYIIKPIPPGKYDVKASYMGYHVFTYKGVLIVVDGLRDLNIEMSNLNIKIQEIEVIWKPPLIDKDNTEVKTTMTSEEIAKLPSRSAGAVAASVGGVFTDENGNVGGIRGQRASGTITFIDGVRVEGSGSLPQSAIDQVSVITGGIPAQYGDLTGGVINITSKGPARKFAGGFQYETTELLDHAHNNLLGFNVMGPLIYGKDSTQGTSLLGFFIAGEFSSGMAGSTALDEYRVNPTLRAELEENPLRLSGTGMGTYPNSYFITKKDLVKVKEKEHTLNQGINLSAKLDVRTTNTTNLTFGGGFNYNNGLGYSRANLLLNEQNSGLGIGYTWRAYGKFTQRFPTERDSKSIIKNVYYTIQVDYTGTKSTSQDAEHKDNLFKYGYIGKFTTYRKKSYEEGTDTVLNLTGKLQNGFADTLYDFQQADFNRTTGNYTGEYYRLFPKNSGAYRNYTLVQNFGGLLNSDYPTSVYGIWSNTGSRVTSYGKSTSGQIELKATGSADIKNHALQFGLYYQQNTYRSQSINAYGLWYLMRQKMNKHIEQLDKKNPKPVYDANNVFQDTINYDRLYSPGEQAFFDLNLRKSLGLAVDGTDYIDIDSYDMNSHTINYYSPDGKMHTTPLKEDLNINWFSADELLNSGNSYIGYYGYDYAGNKLNGKPTLDDFFTKRDANGNYRREIPAFQPIYMAGYIQDKFAFNDLVFNIGVRIDRYDLNQPVLKDPYLFKPARTVGDVKAEGQLWAVTQGMPDNMGSDYVVYVDDLKEPSKILGYRNGNTWYNSKGTEVTDPSILKSNGNILPYLFDPDQKTILSNAFKAYTPQTTVMPRISFSFPISDEALFFAHYDILTKRPTDGTQLDLIQYLFIQNASTSQINNPNLKPERDVDYELGFQQKLSNTSSLKVSAYYRELRDLVQSFRFTEAYPQTYISFNNLDFGTVKGLNVAYDLRRTGNIWIKASYNLQFANGTGSTASDALALVNSGQPNLRTIFPLSFDKRHEIKVSLDYRFSEGKDYNGPKISRKIKGTDNVKTLLLLENTGINLSFRGGSGIPYTARDIIGNAIKGSLNGARIPWQFAIDARIDKDFLIKIKRGKDKVKKIIPVNVYVLVFNVLNTMNVMNVYPTTGNPEDNGFLSAAQNQNAIRSQISEQSFRDLYSLYVNSPGNYMLPRRIHFGVQFSL